MKTPENIINIFMIFKNTYAELLQAIYVLRFQNNYVADQNLGECKDISNITI